MGPSLGCFVHNCFPSAWQAVGARWYFWTDECRGQVVVRGGPWILEVRCCDRTCHWEGPEHLEPTPGPQGEGLPGGPAHRPHSFLRGCRFAPELYGHSVFQASDLIVGRLSPKAFINWATITCHLYFWVPTHKNTSFLEEEALGMKFAAISVMLVG